MRLSICTIYRPEDAGYIPGMVQSLPPNVELILMRTVPWERPRSETFVISEKEMAGMTIKECVWYYYCEDATDPWNPDKENAFSFSRAKNACKGQATGDLIFFLNSDERIANWQEIHFDDLLNTENDVAAFLVNIFSYHDGTDSLLIHSLKIIKNLPGVYYTYRVHENILPSLTANGLRWVNTPVLINHIGYQGADMIYKLKRNLYLLNKDLEDDPDYAFGLEKKAGTIRTLDKLRSYKDG